jgi:NADP-dependent 3-hydroxy acid dehydrogenase YdfG
MALYYGFRIILNKILILIYMKTIYNILDLTDDDLKQLMEKYKEKKMRYDLMYNEATIRTERIILNIHLEQVRRFRETHLKAFRDAKIDTS